MMNMPRDSQDAKGHSPVQRNVSTPLTSHNKGSASAQSDRASDNSVHRGRHSAGQEQRQRGSSSSSSEERRQSQRQSVTRDDRRDSSSSSTEDSDPRQGRSRRKSPAPPKLPTFTGEDVSLKWPSFVFQFERTATRYNWSKADRLLDCLDGKALEFVRELRLECDYKVLTRKLGRRFDIRDAPSTVRREL